LPRLFSQGIRHTQHSEPASEGFKGLRGKLGRHGTSANSHNLPEDQIFQFSGLHKAPRCHSLRSYRCWTHLCSLSVFGFQMLVMSQWLFQTSHWLLRILSLSVPPADSGSCQVSASKNTGRF
ncbi:mCG123423, isoform CRA_b, partial [Mus musculus]